MSKLFLPPTVEEGPIGEHRLFYYYTMTRGVSVLKIDGEYIEVREPSQDEIALATEVYLGGHEYIVTDTEGAALTAAGYTVYDV